MNKQELNGALSHIHASDGLKKEVLTMKCKSTIDVRKLTHRVAVCAAALALLIGAVLFWPASEENYITAPGLIKVYAHELDESGNEIIESVALEEGVDFTSSVVYDPTKSYRQHFPFSFALDKTLYPNMDITLEVSTDAGIFYKNDSYVPKPNIPTLTVVEAIFSNYYGQHFTVDIDKKLYWEPEGFDYAYMAEQIKNGNRDFDSAYKDYDYVNNPSFIDVIIRADNSIVGYCVIAIREINEDDGHPDREFSFELLTMVSFPEVDGHFQNVSYKYVQTQIQQIHSERESKT